MLSLDRAQQGRRVTWLSLVGLVLVPVIVAAGFLWATWGAGDRLHRVEAAVVNLDEAVTLNGQTVPLGRQLAGGLIDSEEENLNWNLVDEAEARDGVRSGKYVAAVTIPANFSKAATSYSKDPADAEQATISVRTSQVNGVADSAIAETVAGVARAKLNETLTETYLDNVYVGFNKQADSLSDVATGAGDLADGASGLSDGVTKASDGAGQLAAGLGELAEGTKELPAQTRKLADGADGIHDGAAKLATGTGQYAKGVRQYTDGVGQLSGGAKQLSDGLTKLEKGLPAAPSSGSGSADPSQLTDGIAKLDRGANGISDGLAAVDGQYQAIRDGKADPRTKAGLQAAMAQPTQQFCPHGATGGTPDEQLVCQAFLAGTETGSRATAGLASAALNTSAQPGQPTLIQGAKSLADGVGQLNDQAGQIVKGLSGLPAQLAELRTGVAALAQGGKQLASGVGELDRQGDKLADGADGIATGVSGLSDGTKTYAQGVNTFAEAMPQLVAGIQQSATGGREFAQGMTSLDDGASKLSDGTRQLADGLKKGADQVPTYTQSERENLSKVVAQPVSDGGSPTDVIAESPATTLLMILALWLGGLATFLIVAAVPNKTLLSSSSSAVLALRAMAPGAAIAAVQAIALTIVGQIVLDLSPAKVVGVLITLLLAGFTFVGVNHALVGWLGGFGRLISVVMVVITAAGAITSAVPAGFDTLAMFSPLTPALSAVRIIVNDGTGLPGAIGTLMVWLLAAVLGSVTAVLRRRSVSAKQLLTVG